MGKWAALSRDEGVIWDTLKSTYTLERSVCQECMRQESRNLPALLQFLRHPWKRPARLVVQTVPVHVAELPPRQPVLQQSLPERVHLAGPGPSSLSHRPDELSALIPDTTINIQSDVISLFHFVFVSEGEFWTDKNLKREFQYFICKSRGEVATSSHSSVYFNSGRFVPSYLLKASPTVFNNFIGPF